MAGSWANRYYRRVNDTVARFIVEPLERGFGYTGPTLHASRSAVVAGRSQSHGYPDPKAFSMSSRPLKASSKTSRYRP